jgi:DNA-binding transcriptional regulator LsrR (DeoR family)
MKTTNKNSQNLLDELGLTKDALRNSGALGDIAYSFFDAEGNTKPEWEIFPGIGIERLKEMAKSEDKRIVTTVGRYKINSLKSILKGKLCNVLITDAEAAEIILK